MKRTAKKKSSKQQVSDQSDQVEVNGFIKAQRSVHPWEVWDRSANAWKLLCILAWRAWRGPGKNRYGCGPGEGFVGDWEERNFSRKEYRVAQKILEDMGLASFRATTKGTIGKLVNNWCFDINVEPEPIQGQHEGPTRGHQGANEGPSEGHQGASQGPTEGQQGATNKNLRSEEVKNLRNQETKNNNNTGVVGATPSGSKAGAAPPDPRSASDGDDDDDMTPDQKAILLSKKLPVVCKMIGRLNRLPVFTQDTMSECREYFERNTDYLPTDVVYMVIMGIKRGREEPVPQEGVDPYWWCRHYAHNPNKLWTTNNDGDLILAVMQKELKYIPYDHDENECAALIEREFAALKEEGQTAP